MMPRLIRSTPALAAVALLLAACGDDDGGGGGAARLGTGDDFSVAASLTEIPAFAETANLMVSTADLLAVDAANGAERPSSASADDVPRWLVALEGAGDAADVPVYAMLPRHLVEMAAYMGDFEDGTGFSLVEADAFVQASLPPDQFTVLAGEAFDGDVVADELAEVTDGIVSTGDGEDYASDLTGDRIFDRLGRPLRIAESEGAVAMSLSTPLAEAWVAGAGETLADDESLATVAAALDEADAISAVLVVSDPDAGSPLPPDLTPEQIEELGLDESAPRYGSVGLGWAEDGTITVVFDYGTADAATDAAAGIEEAFEEGESMVSRRPIADLLDLDSVTTEDRLVIATVTPGPEGRAATPVQMIIARDVPFLG